MTPAQVDAVQSSFKKVAQIQDAAADLFYDRLFTLDPSLKPLFKGDLKDQKRKLMAALGTVVTSLKAPEKIIPVVQNLGEKHNSYGVTEQHYQTVGEALLWTLEKGLGADFTPNVRDGWTAAYGLLSSIMIEAAKQAPMKDEFRQLLAQAYFRLNKENKSVA